MDSFEPKKLALIRILQILERYTDSEHPLKHEEIVKKLENDYGITVERKAIGRNISLLQEAGYDIETTKKGSYLNSRLFEDSELRLLSDGVLASQHITVKHSKDLIEKLPNYQRPYKWTRKNVSDLFGDIDTAISDSRRPDYTDFKYRIDSIIGFTHFLLHVLKVFASIELDKGSCSIPELLDDKKLLDIFTSVIESGKQNGKSV